MQKCDISQNVKVPIPYTIVRWVYAVIKNIVAENIMISFGRCKETHNAV